MRTQEYGNWQLIVVDDGSSDGTPEFLDQIASEDGRVIALRQLPEGVGAARNKGLAAATGDVVCYLDDDNLMGSLWLKSVAWAFDRDPELELLYGARITDVERGQGSSSADLPFLHFEPFDRALLALGNFIDLGVIAHRRSLPEAKFDESLQALGDWDLLLRLTERARPAGASGGGFVLLDVGSEPDQPFRQIRRLRVGHPIAHGAAGSPARPGLHVSVSAGA